MDVLMSGATGLIGSALTPELEAGGHRVRRLTRTPRSEGDIGWDPDAGTIAGDLAGTGAVVHLAGESIAEGRWTQEKKRRILESRREGTRLLAEKVAGLSEPPSVMVSASAIGYYGDRGNELLTRGERTRRPLPLAGVPGVGGGGANLRVRLGSGRAPAVWNSVSPGIFPESLGHQGGDRASQVRDTIGTGVDFARILLQACGGRQDRVRQAVLGWVSLDDVVGVIVHAIENDALSGPVNVVGPDPLDRREYTGSQVASWVVRRSSPCPPQRPASRSADMAEEMLLASVRVEPAKLEETGIRVSATQTSKAPYAT